MSGTSKLIVSTRIPLHIALQTLGWASSSRSLREINRGVVLVDDEQVTDPLHPVDIDKASIAVNGMELSTKTSAAKTIIWHKPASIDGFSDVAGSHTWIKPAGSLPKSASGIVILTNENRYADHVSAPIAHLTCDYEVRVQQLPIPDDLQAYAQSIHQHVDTAEDVNIEILRKSKRGSTIGFSRARYRLVDVARSMKEHGFEVLSWKRTRVGPFSIKDYEQGAWQRLRPGEIAALDEMMVSGINDATPLDNVYEEIVRSASN